MCAATSFVLSSSIGSVFVFPTIRGLHEWLRVQQWACCGRLLPDNRCFITKRRRTITQTPNITTTPSAIGINWTWTASHRKEIEGFLFSKYLICVCSIVLAMILKSRQKPTNCRCGIKRTFPMKQQRNAQDYLVWRISRYEILGKH